MDNDNCYICYICGYSEHPPTAEHNYWSNSDAAAEFAAEDNRLSVPNFVPAEYQVYGS